MRGAIVVGGTNVDLLLCSDAPIVAGTSNPGSVTVTPGGVGRNIAENLARLGTSTRLISRVGDDAHGDLVLTATAKAGVDVAGVLRSDAATGVYTAVLDSDGELVVAISAMAVTAQIDAVQIDGVADLLRDAGLVVLDGNLSTGALDAALDIAAAAGVHVIVEPVSVPKAQRVAPLLRADRPVFAVTPNRDEVAALTGLPVGERPDDPNIARAVEQLHERGVENVWVRLGADGSLLSTPDGVTRLAAVPVDVVDVTGAGDAMLGAFAHELLQGADLPAAAAYAHAAAALTVASHHTVRPDLTDPLVRSLL